MMFLKNFLINFFVLPIFLFIYLSLPRVWASFTFSNFQAQFTNSYNTLTTNFVYLFIGVYFLLSLIKKRIAKVIFILVLHILFLVRWTEMMFMRDYKMSFSPPIFANINLDNFLLGIKQNTFLVTCFIIFVIFIILCLSYLPRFLHYTNKLQKNVFFVLYVLISIRSIYILEEESWHAHDDFASYQLISASLKYYGNEYFQTLNKLHWSDEELALYEKMGLSFVIPKNISQEKSKHYNLITIYLEGFNTEYVYKNNTFNYSNTPNLVHFAKENMFFPNFYSVSSPTLNGIISSFCGIIARYNNDVFYKNSAFSLNKPCISDILHTVGYCQIFVTGTGVSYPKLRIFLNMHKFDKNLKEEDILKNFQNENFKSRDEFPSLFDHELTKVSKFFLNDLLKNKKQPFHFSIVTNNTHPPYKTPSPFCESLEDKKLHAIKCTDHAIGELLNFIKKNGLLKNTVIIIVGDHRQHGDPNMYGKVFLALYSPDITKKQKVEIEGYTPDIAPTILELLGFNIQKLFFGNSLLSTRKKYPYLIAPEVEFYRGKTYLKEDCPSDLLIRTKNKSLKFLSNCENTKLSFYQTKFLLDE